jgi:aspartyl-tRNA(Asn)/glutamyl-tRNA(Gln) amidotransferase subunit A
VNAVLTLCAEECLDGAAESGRRLARGEARPLEGIPFGLKDVIATRGIRTTGGSTIYRDYVPSESAVHVDRLQAAGAVLLAKLQTIQFAFGDNPHYGPTRNPWSLEHSPGASSSGSGASVAARELPLAVGTDTGGSIRVPAAFCGVVGFKATYGRVPRHGVMAQSWTLDHIGPMTRTVEDAALMLQAMAGHDPRDPTSAREPVPDWAAALHEGVRGVRLGVPSDWFFDVCDSEVAAATRAAVDVLVGAGATAVEVPLPNARLADTIGWTIMYAEFASLHEVTFDRLDDYGPGMTRQLLASSQFVSAQDYLRSLRARHLLQLDFEAAFEQVDALVVPGICALAPRLDATGLVIDGVEHPWVPTSARTTLIFNLAGIPALSVPAGFGRDGLPLGIQVAARPYAEATCLRVGHAFQELTDHHTSAPPLVATAAA